MDKQDKIVYQKPAILDLAEITPAHGGGCLSGASAPGGPCTSGTNASGGFCTEGTVGSKLDIGPKVRP